MRSIILFVLLYCSVTMAAYAGHVSGDSAKRITKDSTFVLNNESLHASPVVEQPDVLLDGLIQTTVTDSIQRYIDLAQSLLDKVEQTQKFISSIDANTKFELPVGIKKTLGGIEYVVLIEAIRIKPTHAELDVFLKFTIPQNQKSLTFMARGIKLTKKGGIVGDAKLELLGDNAINFNGDKIQLIIKGGNKAGGSGTYAVIDCDGFREVSLDAGVKFSRDLIRPENADGKIMEGNVTAGFKATVSDWNDLLIQLDMPAFQVTSLKDFGFKASDVVFDFSDTRNAPAVVFPAGYQNTQALPGNENTWRGFYMRELLIRMPSQFQKKSGAGTELRAQNMLIDNRGLSGLFSGKNLIPLNEGNMNGWAFSLDELAFELMANELKQASFDGQVLIPVSKETTPFDYSAFISGDNEYLFSVSTASDLEFDLWHAGNVQIYEGSSLEIRVADNKFLPKAVLHGNMNISAKLGSGASAKGVELANISFENLELQVVKPYLKVGTFSFGSELAQQKLAQFPISIQNIGMRSVSDTETALDFNLILNLTGEDNGLSADGGLSIIGVISNENGSQRWKPKGLEVRELTLDANIGAISFYGKVIFYKQDPVYGNGFNGIIKASFTPGLKLDCTAIFGNVEGMRYWYADAMVHLQNGIPVFTGVGIYGFGGGAYYAMKMDKEGLGSELGRTVSGVVYVPDSKAGLGLKAVVALGSHPKPEAFNADVTFEISFFKGGGVRRIAFSGNAFLVTPGLDLNVDKLKETTGKMVAKVNKMAGDGMLAGDASGSNSMDDVFGSLESAGDKGQISAKASIEYDFENKTLHGTFEAYVNVIGGIVKGVGPGGRAGWSVMHFSPSEWYVYVGTPDDRIGLSIGIGSIRAQATSYMMVGTKILGSPPPPENVSRILGGVDLDYMRDLNALGTGAGFAFGAAFGVDTGDLSFLIFYGRFAAGAGFDIMLKDYGDARCEGQSKPLGINGWYANGQAYAYVEGKVGIRVRVFGRKKKINILEIGAATVLQAKLPNPFWMRGIVGGHYSILGGIVKGRCKFEMTIGKECKIEGNENVLDDIKVIAEITPEEGAKEISVFNAPQGVFNMEVDKQFEIIDPEDNTPRYFKVKLNHFRLLDAGREIPATMEWSPTQDVVALKPFDVLPPQKPVKASLEVSFEEKISGSWRSVVVDGKAYTESKASTFETGEAPDYIPEENILYNYPLSNQLNFYKGENAEGGYIKLKQGQPYLFQVSNEWKQKVRYKGATGNTSMVEVNYVQSDARVTFPIPQELSPETVFQFEIVNIPVSQYEVDQNVSREYAVTQGDDMETEVRTNTAEGELEILAEKPVFSTYFRTSKYATFREKIASLSISNSYSLLTIPWHVHKVMTYLNGAEYFDEAELSGTTLTENKPLIRIEADLTDMAYYRDYVYPLVYQGYPLDGNIRITRDTSILGLPPARASYVGQTPSDLLLRNENITAGGPVSVSASRAYYTFDMPYYVLQDFREIQAQVVNRYINQTSVSDRVHKILFSPVPILTTGQVKYKLRYFLPGVLKKTAETTVTVSY